LRTGPISARAGRGRLLIDNVVSHADQARDFRAVVDADDRVAQARVPIRTGVLLDVRA
jgi:hypothetical protein